MLVATTSLLGAQSVNDFSGAAHHEWRLILAPQFENRVLTGTIGINENLLPPQQNISPFLIDTFVLNGQEQVYLSDITGNRIEAIPLTKNFWFGIGLDHWWRSPKGADIGVGFFFSQGNYEGKFKDFDQPLPSDYYYRILEKKVIRGGLTFRGQYHLWRNMRIHPYVGANIFLLMDRTTTDGQVSYVFPFYDTVLAGEAITPRFRNNLIFDFDLAFSVGFVYQLTPTWGMNLEVNSHKDDFAGILRFGISRKFLSKKRRNSMK